jgi:hypothetical protein
MRSGIASAETSRALGSLSIEFSGETAEVAEKRTPPRSVFSE